MKRVFIEIDAPDLAKAEALRDILLEFISDAPAQLNANIKVHDSGIQDEPFGVTPRELTREDVLAKDSLLIGVLYPLGFEDLDAAEQKSVVDFLNLVRSWK